VRSADGIRIGYGLILLARPGLLAGSPTATGAPPMKVVVRILGARHVLQGAVSAIRPTSGVRRAGAALDALHAATDLLYGAATSRWAPAATDAAIAFLLGSANVMLARVPARR
jgi:hypothetical protein